MYYKVEDGVRDIVMIIILHLTSSIKLGYNKLGLRYIMNGTYPMDLQAELQKQALVIRIRL